MPLSIRSDQLKDEWKLVQLEQEGPEMGISDGVRIEKYWNHFMKFKGPDGSPIIEIIVCIAIFSGLKYHCVRAMYAVD